MPEPILSIDISEIREGKLEEVKTAMKELVEFVEANEHRPIAYNVYFNDDGSRMTVAQMHPDSASMEFHMEIAGSRFPKMGEWLTLLRIDTYGKASDTLLQQLRRKAHLLGGAALEVHQLHAGFTRLRMEQQ